MGHVLPVNIDDIATEYNRGATSQQIGSRLGVCALTIRRWLRGSGVAVRPRTGLHSRIHQFNQSAFSVIDTENKAYWLGFIMADGHLWKGMALQIGLAVIDQVHLEKLKAFFGGTQPIYKKLQPASMLNGRMIKQRESVHVQFSSKQLVSDLGRLGIGNSKLVNPADQLSVDLRRHYYRGLFDGDGSLMKQVVRTSHVQWEMNQCGHFAVVNGFSEFARSTCGAKASVRAHRGIYYCSLHGNAKPKQLAKEMYADSQVFLDRKHTLFLEMGV